MHYLKEINKRFKFTNIFFNSIIIAIIIFLIDYYNIISILINNYKLLTKISMFILVIFCIKEIINNKMWRLINIETINYFDKILILVVLSQLFLFTYYAVNKMNYKFLTLYSLIITIIILVVRLFIIERLFKKNLNKETNIYSISDLYKKNINKEDLVLLEEKELINSDNDLLDMEIFASTLEYSLLQCKPKENYVIALIGKWGCGKSSVINILKQKINDTNDSVIGVYNPWKYDNKLSLFKGFYSFIFKLFGKNYGYFNYRNLLRKYENMIFNLVEDKTSLSLHSLFNIDSDSEIEEIKNSINDCINFNNKKIIVVIDDIDRLEKEQILLIFRTIKTLFDFNNIIYILCYDEERINKIFKEELNIDSDYLNKIVQNKIIMPKIDSQKIIQIGTKCVLNLLEIYSIKNYNKAKLESNLKIIFNDFTDLREIIRFINTISISIKNCIKINLDICDYIGLEYIKFKDLNLYNTIYNNSTKFISEDRNYNSEYDWEDTKEFNEKAIEFYNTIFESKDNMKKLLSNIFPYVDNYSHGYTIRHDGLFVSDERRKSIISNRCCNGRYFKCFFTIRSCFFTLLNDILNKFISNVNYGNDISIEFNNLFDGVNPNNYDLLFELMEIKLDKIDNQENIFNYILTNINKFEDNPRFLALTSNNRAKILLSAIISNEQNFTKRKEYLNKICEKDLLVLDSVLYWLGTDKYCNENYDETYLYAKKILCDSLNKNIKNKTDIFSKETYIKHYCWLFSKHIEDKEKTKKYLNKLINKNNIFKIIAEGINTFVGSEIRYEYNIGPLEKIIDIKKLDTTLKQVDYELNEDQEKVLSLYKNKDKKQEISEINYNNL